MERDINIQPFSIVPDEILVKILQYTAVLELSTLCSLDKRLHALIDLDMKQLIIEKSLYNNRTPRAIITRKKWSNELIKIALAQDNPRAVEFFIKNSVTGSLEYSIVELTPATRKYVSYETKQSSTTSSSPSSTELFVDAVVKQGLVNIFKWFVAEWERIWPDIAERKHSPAFHVFWLAVLHAAYTSHKNNANSFQKVSWIVLEQLEIYSDMIVRLLIANLGSISIGSYPNKKVVPVHHLLKEDPRVVLQYLSEIRQIGVKIDFFNPSPHCIDVKDIDDEPTLMQKLMKLRPIEASYFQDYQCETMLKIVPKEHYGAILPIALSRPNLQLYQYKLLSGLIERGADINALLPEELSKSMSKRHLIESALGIVAFESDPQKWEIEWLLSNGAKFSEKEEAEIISKNDAKLRQILEATKKPYNLFMNRVEKLDHQLYHSRDYNLRIYDDKFELEENGYTFVGSYNMEGSKLTCYGKKRRYYFRDGKSAYDPGENIEESYDTRYTFIAYKSVYNCVVLRLHEDEADTDPRSFEAFFYDLIWGL